HSASMLLNILYLDKVFFAGLCNPYDRLGDHQIYAEAIYDIVKHCPYITGLRMILGYPQRPEELEYLRARRLAVPRGSTILPRSLKVFPLRNETETLGRTVMPLVKVLTLEAQSVATTIRNSSASLRDLKLENTALMLDFLCPLNKEGQPTLPVVYWPHLETISLHNVTCWTDEGNWLTFPTEEAQARIATVQQWEQGHDHPDDSHPSQPVIEIEHFHRLFISMGLAVQHMPRLSSIYFHPGAETELTFEFRVVPGRYAIATWSSRPTYRPDHKVADAWGFSEEGQRHAKLGVVVYSVRFMAHMV
ncbi:hypothetical protein BO85DRAFT_381422, partial [Aspergillus piperis CBS 112811]